MPATTICQLTNKARFQVNLDAYHALNSSAIQSPQTAFGPSAPYDAIEYRSV